MRGRGWREETEGVREERDSEGEKRLGFCELGILDYYWARPIYCGGHTQTPQKIEVLTETVIVMVTVSVN